MSTFNVSKLRKVLQTSLGMMPLILTTHLVEPPIQHPGAPTSSSIQTKPLPIPKPLPTPKSLPIPEPLPKPEPAPAEEVKTPERAQQVLDFWFGKLSGPDFFPTDKIGFWLGNTPINQEQVTDNFTRDVEYARRGEYNSWRNTAKGRLALILLLDQIPRILFNHSHQAFSSDAMSRGLSLEGIQLGEDKQLYPVERAFFYFPLAHAESLYLQEMSLRLYDTLYLESSGEIKPYMEIFKNFANHNYQVIYRFGRFPYRNQVLNRVNTPEENIFLAQPRV